MSRNVNMSPVISKHMPFICWKIWDADYKDTIVVESSVPFSKRYLKYLSKKYLKKQDMREYLRLVASNKNTYTMKYLNIANDEAAAPEGKWTS